MLMMMINDRQLDRQTTQASQSKVLLAKLPEKFSVIFRTLRFITIFLNSFPVDSAPNMGQMKPNCTHINLCTALPLYRDRRFATLQRTLFIYLINKYISLSDICLTVHHWYKLYRQPTRCNNNGLLIIPVSSTCFGKLFCPSSGTLDYVLQLVV